MEIVAQFSGIVKFFIYFLTSVFLTLLFLTLYIRITPYKEFSLINNGNAAKGQVFLVLGHQPLYIVVRRKFCKGDIGHALDPRPVARKRRVETSAPD